MDVQVNVSDTPNTGQWDRVYNLQWDYDWDTAFPSSADSGLHLWTPVLGVVTDWTGYSDTLSFDDLYSGVGERLVFPVILSGPSPDYSSYTYVDWSGGPGEYWIDFNSAGTPRISTSAPFDFGKWAWDGSINPNYVAPLTKKHHGKK